RCVSGNFACRERSMNAGSFAEAVRSDAVRRAEVLWDLSAQRRVTYKVILANGLFDHPADISSVLGIVPGNRALVVIDRAVEELHGDRIRRAFSAGNIHVSTIKAATGETNKSIDSVLETVRAFDAFGLARRAEPVLAVGGGVLSDVVGFAANMFRRGVPYI